MGLFRANVPSSSDIAKALRSDTEERKPQPNSKSNNSNKQSHHRNGTTPVATSSTATNAPVRPKRGENRGGKDQSRRGPTPLPQSQPRPQQQPPSQPEPQLQPQPKPEHVVSNDGKQ